MKSARIQRIHQVISGQANDVSARLMRSGLRTLEPVYRTVTGIRNRAFDRGSRVQQVGVPVISIGNLTTGGTGKTPMVRWVVRQLSKWGQHPAIVSRGYGSRKDQPNDEFLELQLFLPETPHIQDPDRPAAARLAIQGHNASVIVLDDGFQHRRIGRELDIVLIDATCPFGYEHLLPRGLLREPVESLARCDVVVITRVDQVDDSQVQQILHRVAKYVEEDKVAQVHFRSHGLIDTDGETVNLQPDLPVLAFCGIGNPDGFRTTLNSITSSLTEFRAFPDHHNYSQSDLDGLRELASNKNASALICTVKDIVKLRQLKPPGIPVFAVAIEATFDTGQTMLEDALKSTTNLSGNEEDRS